MTGRQLKELLKKHKVNQSALARKLGMSPQALYERLKSENPAYSFVELVLQAAGITLDPPAGAVADGADEKHGEVLESGDGYLTLKNRYTACMEENTGLKSQVIALQAELLALARSGQRHHADAGRSSV